jgi:hypothetical protein
MELYDQALATSDVARQGELMKQVFDLAAGKEVRGPKQVSEDAVHEPDRIAAAAVSRFLGRPRTVQSE